MKTSIKKGKFPPLPDPTCICDEQSKLLTLKIYNKSWFCLVHGWSNGNDHHLRETKKKYRELLDNEFAKTERQKSMTTCPYCHRKF